MTIGIKVSEKGYDVNTAANKNIVLSTERNCLKLDNVATTTLVVRGGGVGTRTIDHGQSFIPVVIAFINIGGSYFFFPFSDSGGDNVGDIMVNGTNIVFDMLSSPGSYTIYYFLSKTESI